MSESRGSFWLFATAYLAGWTAIGSLAMAATVPEFFEVVGTTGVVVSQVVAVACLGVIGWQVLRQAGPPSVGLEMPRWP